MMRAAVPVFISTVLLAGGAGAQVGPGFTLGPSPAVALLGCDVVGADEPEVAFAQIPGGLSGRRLIGPDDFEGESCAEVLSVLLGAGFRILESRPVRRGGGREIIVYDLIAREPPGSPSGVDVRPRLSIR